MGVGFDGKGVYSPYTRKINIQDLILLQTLLLP